MERQGSEACWDNSRAIPGGRLDEFLFLLETRNLTAPCSVQAPCA